MKLEKEWLPPKKSGGIYTAIKILAFAENMIEEIWINISLYSKVWVTPRWHLGFHYAVLFVHDTCHNCN